MFKNITHYCNQINLTSNLVKQDKQNDNDKLVDLEKKVFKNSSSSLKIKVGGQYKFN